jgi:hypothetical protein
MVNVDGVGVDATQFAGKPNKTKQITPPSNEKASYSFYIAIYIQNHLKPEKVYVELKFLLEKIATASSRFSILAFCARSFKSQISAVTTLLVNVNAHCGTVLSIFEHRGYTSNGTQLSHSSISMLLTKTGSHYVRNTIFQGNIFFLSESPSMLPK